MRKQIIKNSLWGNINLAIRYGLSFVATAIIAKFYGPEIFGVYQLAVTYLAVLDLFTLLSPHHLRNYLVGNLKKEGSVASVWIYHHVFVSLAILTGVAYFWWKSDYALVYTLLIISLAKIFSRVFDYPQIILDSRLRGDLVQKVQIISIGTFNIFRMGMALLKVTPEILSGATFAQAMASIWYQIKTLRIMGGVKIEKFSFELFVELIKGGWLLTVMSLLVGMQGRIVSLMLAEKMSPSDYGSFQLVFKLIEPATMIATVLFSANYTALANTFVNSKEVFFKRFLKISTFAMGAAVSCTLVLIIIPVGWWVKLFGESYRVGLEYLWMGSGVVFSGVIMSLSTQIDLITLRYLSACFKNISVITIYLIATMLLPQASVGEAMMLYSIVPLVVVVLCMPLDFIKIRRLLEM